MHPCGAVCPTPLRVTTLLPALTIKATKHCDTLPLAVVYAAPLQRHGGTLDAHASPTAAADVAGVQYQAALLQWENMPHTHTTQVRRIQLLLGGRFVHRVQNES